MKSYYVWTIGCQMNSADADRLRRGLAEMDYVTTSDPVEADLVVLITCVVRQSAEDKVVGRLSSLRHLKRTRPETLIAVMGCFVDDEPSLRERFPHVDAFFRPSEVTRLLGFLRARGLGNSVAEAKSGALQAIQPVTALVPISYGCDHHCTYCIVRLRRGAQRSRRLEELAAEVQNLVLGGAHEVTLLGQNVDAYGADLGPGVPDLADLLCALETIEGLRRLRFLTSHPADLSPRLIQAVASRPKVCPHFELPVQAGDDRTLRRMGRNYTIAGYRELVAAIRCQVPGCSIATDVIVGFPGEDEAQFRGTYDLLASVRFDAVHIAKYSVRPGTAAARLPDDIPDNEKERRRNLLEAMQTRIAAEMSASLLGKTVEVLVEGRQRGRWKGRSVNNKLVFFEHGGDWRGQLVSVWITWAGPWSLIGEAVTLPSSRIGVIAKTATQSPKG